MPDIFRSENDTMGKEAYEAGVCIDMEPYLDEIPNFDDYYPLENIEKVKNQFGEMVIWDPFAVRASGYYYNKDHFAEAGFDGPPQTFADFFDLCQELKAEGFTPVAMMTGDNGWTMHFWYAAMMAAHSEEGLSYAMNPQTTVWDSAPFRWATENVKMLINEYANPDAIGATYDMVERQMYAERVSMIGNGPWMASNYSNPDRVGSADFVEHIGYAPMPGGFYFGYADKIGHGPMVAPNGEERELGGMLFWGTELQPQIIEKNVTELGWFVSAYDYPEDIMDQQPLVSELQMLIQEWDATALPWFYDTWTNAVMADGMTRNMDLYAQDEITLDEYVENVAEFAEAVGEE